MPSELIPWRAEIERLRREMDQLCQRFSDLRFLRRFAQAGEWHPIIDISESESERSNLALSRRGGGAREVCQARCFNGSDSFRISFIFSPFF